MTRFQPWAWVLAGFVAFSFAPAHAKTPIVVLIPGFFNSLAGSYFSDTIVSTIESKGYDTVIVKDLNPLGDFDTNGILVQKFLENLNASDGGRPMILIGHSAGGFYALDALTRDPKLPVTTLVTVSTPFTGVRFIEKLGGNDGLVQKLAKFVDLNSLVQMTAAKTEDFLASVRRPPGLRLIATGGTQKSCLPFSCFETEKLSWLLSLTQALAGQPSDGIVTYDSALAEHLPVNLGPIERPGSLQIHLEHWEQVLDYRVFTLLGTFDVGYVRNEQRRFYSALMDYLN